MSTLTLVRLTAAEAVVPATRTRPKANGAARAARRAALARTLLSTLVTIGVTADRRPGPGARRRARPVAGGTAEELDRAEGHEPGRQQRPDARRVARRDGGDSELAGRDNGPGVGGPAGSGRSINGGGAPARPVPRPAISMSRQSIQPSGPARAATRRGSWAPPKPFAPRAASRRSGMSGATAKTACPVNETIASRPGRQGGTRRQPPSGSGNRPAAAAAISPASGCSPGLGCAPALGGSRDTPPTVPTDASRRRGPPRSAVGSRPACPRHIDVG